MTAQFSNTITFGVEDNRIGYSTLTTALVNYVSFLQELNSKLYPGAKLNVKILPFKQGSFVLDQEISIEQDTNLVNSDDTSDTIKKNLLKTSSDVIKIRSQIASGGVMSQADKGTVQIATTKGAIEIYALQAYQFATENKNVDQSLTEFFSAVKKEKQAKYVKFSSDSDDELTLSISQEEIANLTTPLIVQDQPETSLKVESQVELVVYGIVFETGKKWNFVWGTRRISATIIDKSFNDSVDSGQQEFGKGTKIVADLIIHLAKDKAVPVMIETGEYSISKVYSVVKSPKQLTIQEQSE